MRLDFQEQLSSKPRELFLGEHSVGPGPNPVPLSTCNHSHENSISILEFPVLHQVPYHPVSKRDKKTVIFRC
jgi:hypothetical protein